MENRLGKRTIVMRQISKTLSRFPLIENIRWDRPKNFNEHLPDLSAIDLILKRK
jgi:hypothetical protein